MFIINILIVIYSYFFHKYSIWEMTPEKYIFLYKELKNFYSFSEYYEDLILYSVLFDSKDKFYIDIGAFDPISVSVTKILYLKGWHGINIEPQIDKIELFKKDRPNDINLQITVGEKKGKVKFYINDQCSTLEKKYSEGTNYTIDVKMDTMRNICKKYVPNNINIDFCKIDVEGGEKGVLLGYDFINYRPKIFCVESTKPKTMINNYDLWENILEKNNYSYVFSFGVNRFYVDNNYPDIIKRFHRIKKYIKYFKKNYKNDRRSLYMPKKD